MDNKKTIKQALIIFVIVLGLGMYLYSNILGRINNLTQEIPKEQVMNVDYDIEGISKSDACYQMIQNTIPNVYQVEISLDKTVDKDIKGSVYYSLENGFSEEYKDDFIIEEGKSSVKISMPKICKESILIKTEEKVSINGVTLKGKSDDFRNKAKYIYLGGLFVFDLILCILYVLFNKQIVDFSESINRLDAAFKDKLAGLKLNVISFYAIALVCMGLFLSFSLPIGFVPDERTHFDWMTKSIGLENAVDAYDQASKKAVGTAEIYYWDDKLDVEEIEKADTIYFDKSADHFKISLGTLRYLQVIPGFLIGYLLNLPVLWCLQLAEIGALIITLILGVMTLKLLPVKRELMCMILLLPVTIQQCVSFSYDSLVISLACLLIAYILNLKYVKEEVKWKEFFIVAFLSILILYLKIPYGLVGMLFMIIPKEKLNLKIKSLDVGSLLGNTWIRISLVLLCIIVMATGFMVINMRPLFITRALVLHNPSMFARLIVNTLRGGMMYYFTSFIGNFGWLKTPMPAGVIYFTIVVMILLALLSSDKYKSITNKNRFWIGFALCIMIPIIFLSMIGHTAKAGVTFTSVQQVLNVYKEIDRIEGVQGRYFTPIAFSMLLFFDGIVSIKNNRLYILQAIYYIVIFSMTIFTVLNKFWIL
ncbi:MAG: DUF2142 domain-containing protein [Holdemanella sp.]|nr:DUF2142 domain-containing protein [Holdemanella sp.]